MHPAMPSARTLSDSDVADLLADAAKSPRQRAHRTLHASHAEPVQRMVVGVLGGSYFRPHRHVGRFELVVVLRGRVDVLLFDETGTVLERFEAGDGCPIRSFELSGEEWHTLVADAGESVFVEVKPGPFDPTAPGEFAPGRPRKARRKSARSQRRCEPPAPESGAGLGATEPRRTTAESQRFVAPLPCTGRDARGISRP